MQTNKRKEIKGRKEKERKEMRDLDIDIILRKKKKNLKMNRRTTSQMQNCKTSRK